MADEQTINQQPENSAPEGSQGGGEKPFLDSLPEDIRANEALKDVTGPDVLAQRYLETLGKVPKVPEGPDKYTFDDDVKGILNADSLKALAKTAHEAGATEAQAQAIAKYYAAQAKEALEAETAQAEKWDADLKKEWGGNFDANMSVAMKALVGFGDEVAVKALKDSGLAKHPAVRKMFYSIGRAISEDKFDKSGNPETKSGIERGLGGMPMLNFPSMSK